MIVDFFKRTQWIKENLSSHIILMRILDIYVKNIAEVKFIDQGHNYIYITYDKNTHYCLL